MTRFSSPSRAASRALIRHVPSEVHLYRQVVALTSDDTLTSKNDERLNFLFRIHSEGLTGIEPARQPWQGCMQPEHLRPGATTGNQTQDPSVPRTCVVTSTIAALLGTPSPTCRPFTASSLAGAAHRPDVGQLTRCLLSLWSESNRLSPLYKSGAPPQEPQRHGARPGIRTQRTIATRDCRAPHVWQE